MLLDIYIGHLKILASALTSKKINKDCLNPRKLLRKL